MLNAIDIALEKDGVCIISEGTLRRQDTIPKMIDALRELDPTGYEQAECCSPFGIIPGHAQEDEDADWWTDHADYVWNWLSEVLNEAVCIGYSFGAHPDDPACLLFAKSELWE